MAHAVVWKYVSAEGEVRVLTGHPGAFCATEGEALEEGLRISQELQGYSLIPLVVAETDEDLGDVILNCEEIYLGPEDDDEIFYDISSLPQWACHNWWPL